MTPPLQLRLWWLALGYMLILMVTYLSLAPVEVRIPTGQGDKVGHVLAYLALMYWFSQLYASASARRLLAALFCMLAVAMEYAQDMTGYRFFEVADMIAGALGVVLGWAAAPPRTPHLLMAVEAVIVKRGS